MGLIQQEVSPEPEVEIPDEVREAYKLWRPTPLYRARRLERELDTPARIYYKYEGVSPAGSHKPNTAVPQAFENARAGVKKLATETGAGQWGSALAFACRLFGLECEVFMVGSSYDQKPYRRSMMETWGATVHRSPSRADRGRALAGRARDRLAGDRHLRGGRGRGGRPRHQLRARLGAQPRAAPPDGGRPGGDGAARAGGRRARRDRGLRGRRVELRRHRVPVRATRPARGGEDALRGGRAGRLPDPDPRQLPLRLRRHRGHDAADADVHARPRLRPAARARGRAALPRRRADAVRAREGRARRGARLQAERDVRSGAALRPHARGSSRRPSPRTPSAP